MLIMSSTECPWQTKEPLWMLQLPESLVLNGSYLCRRFSSSSTCFWLRHHIPPCSYKCTNKTHSQSSPRAQTQTQIACYGLGNGCLAAETLRELVACLFPPLLCSIETLYNCRQREGGKKKQILLAVHAPCFLFSSYIHPSTSPSSSIQ